MPKDVAGPGRAARGKLVRGGKAKEGTGTGGRAAGAAETQPETRRGSFGPLPERSPLPFAGPLFALPLAVPRALRRGLLWPLDRLAAARGRLFAGVPFCLAAGIGPWFALPDEPGAGVYLAAAALGLAGLGLRLSGGARAAVPGMVLALVATGFLAAGLRAHAVAAPVLGFRYHGPVEGRVFEIDRSWSDRMRVTLDEVRLERVRPARTPARVRVALAEAGPGDAAGPGMAQPGGLPAPGTRLRLTAMLAPPGGPVAPGGFDFRRIAWFERLGAVGYSRAPPEVIAPADPPGWDQRLALAATQARMALAAKIRARIPGQPGALAAALLTGDRSGLDRPSTEAMRAANLSHMLAISGLHMGLVAGFVFGLTRAAMALCPPLLLRVNGRKLAALAALAAATGYLWLAVPAVATQRAWLMAAVVLGAVLADRRAVSLRSVALAASVLLLLRPEALTGPGFQMSFAATLALVLTWRPWSRQQPRLPRLLRPPAALLLSSLTAGLATAPIAAAHFNRIAEYGLAANLLTVPVLGTLVMPAGVLAGLAAPLGLEGLPLWVMGRGCGWILGVAEWVAALEGAVLAVPAPPRWVLPALAPGLAALALLPGWWRLAGAPLVLAAALGWAAPARPPLLVDDSGGLVGLVGPEGRALSRAKGLGFVAGNWLEDDGDLADQATAAARPGFGGPAHAREARLGGVAIRQLIGKRGLAELPVACHDGALVILTLDRPPDFAPGGACDLWDRRRLRASGALAAWPGPRGLVILGARAAAGRRLWSPRTAE